MPRGAVRRLRRCSAGGRCFHFPTYQLNLSRFYHGHSKIRQCISQKGLTLSRKVYEFWPLAGGYSRVRRATRKTT